MTREEIDQVLAIAVAFRDCSLIDIWEAKFQKQFQDLDPIDQIWSRNDYQAMYRAALLFSLISLRKVSDFAENRGTRSDDVRMKDYGLDLEAETGVTAILDDATRETINKAIAHLTSSRLDPDVDEMEALRKVLAEKETILETLGNKFFGMIPAGQ